MGLLLLEAMAMSGKGVAQLLAETMAELGPFHYQRWDLPIDNGRKEELIARLNREEVTTIASRTVVSTNRRDGFKFLFADGSWLLIRPSGTEPLLRLYSEASSLAQVETLLAAGRSMAGV
jgi:phosphomannomutase